MNFTSGVDSNCGSPVPNLASGENRTTAQNQPFWSILWIISFGEVEARKYFAEREKIDIRLYLRTLVNGKTNCIAKNAALRFLTAPPFATNAGQPKASRVPLLELRPDRAPHHHQQLRQQPLLK
jgi:hypothetical protein